MRAGKVLWRLRWAGLAGCAFAAFGSCAQTTAPLTEVLVTIDADKIVASNLTAVEIATYEADAVTALQPVTSVHLEVGAAKAGPGTAQFPFSVGVLKHTSDRFLLLVTGYAGREAVIEQKARVVFVNGEVRDLGVYLAAPCFMALCGGPDAVDWLSRTCDASTGNSVCGDVQVQTTEPVAIGSELDAGLATAPSGPTESDGSTVVGELQPEARADTSEGGAPEEAGADTSESGALPAAVDNCAGFCTSLNYPCAQVAPSSYGCRGQFADWPMPDVVVGSNYAPSYDSSTPGIVADQVTGLIWQRDLPATYTGCTGRYTDGQGQVGDTCTWAEAKSYCDGITLAGQSDWRLPTKIELESIVDVTKAGPAIDTAIFPGTPIAYFWSASPYVASSGYAWIVYFGNGGSVSYGTSTTNRVRCVR
jgi:hypothetical protein